MARPKGSKNKPKAPPADGGPGHNSGKTVEGLNDEQLHALTRQHAAKRKTLVDAEKTAKSNRLNHDKIIKADLGATGLSDIKLLEELEKDGSEVGFQTEIERRLRVARWAGVDLGYQADLFANTAPDLKSRAYNEGFREGAAGKPLDPGHYSPGTDGWEGFTEGWHAAQAEIAGKFKKPVVDGETLIQKAATDKPDAFDGDENKSEWPDESQAAANKASGAAGAPAAVN